MANSVRSASGDEDTTITGTVVASDADSASLTYELVDAGEPRHRHAESGRHLQLHARR